MELIVAIAVGVMVSGGVYLVLRARSFAVVLGIMLLGYGANLLLFASGGLSADLAPLVTPGKRTIIGTCSSSS